MHNYFYISNIICDYWQFNFLLTIFKQLLLTMQVAVFLIYMHKDLHKSLLLNVACWIILNPFLTPLVWEAVGAHAKSRQTCWTLCDPMDYSPLGSSVPEILQTRILEWVALLSSKGTSSPRGQIHLSHISCIGVSSSPLAPPGSLRGWNTKKKKKKVISKTIVVPGLWRHSHKMGYLWW